MSRRTIKELKEALNLLHNRGQLAWMQLAEWKAISDYIAIRPELFKTAPVFWQTLVNSLLDIAMLSMLDLVHPSGTGSLSLSFVLNVAEDRSRSSEWTIKAETLKSAIKSDRAVVSHWANKTARAKEYRDKMLAHFDTKHIGNQLAQLDIGVIPTDIRDALYESSRILNRYSQLLEDTTHTWMTDDLHGFENIGRLLELGFETRQELLEGSETLEGFQNNFPRLQSNWKKEGKTQIDARIERDHIENCWKWSWLERYQRDFRNGEWPR